MALFCVKDGDSSGVEGFNQPLKKVEKSVDPVSNDARYEKTSTSGVVVDTVTGKMETQLPDPTKLVKLPEGAKLHIYTGKRPNAIVMDDIADIEDPKPASLWFRPRSAGKSKLLQEYLRIEAEKKAQALIADMEFAALAPDYKFPAI